MPLTGSGPDLHLGDTGEAVYELQIRLFGLGLLRDYPDGAFGLSTQNAVRALQSQRGEDNDGLVDAETWQALAHQEMQYAIHYQFDTAFDALSQLSYDLQNPQTASGQFGVISGRPGQYTPANQGGLYAPAAQYGDAYGSDGGYGQLSDDGQWQWDGYEWQPAQAAQAAQAAQTATQAWQGDAVPGFTATSALPYDAGYDAATDGSSDVLSDDGQWRWDGYDWQPVTGSAGVLSDDGQWRWDGSQWRPA